MLEKSKMFKPALYMYTRSESYNEEPEFLILLTARKIDDDDAAVYLRNGCGIKPQIVS